MREEYSYLLCFLYVRTIYYLIDHGCHPLHIFVLKLRNNRKKRKQNPETADFHKVCNLFLYLSYFIYYIIFIFILFYILYYLIGVTS